MATSFYLLLSLLLSSFLLPYQTVESHRVHRVDSRQPHASGPCTTSQGFNHSGLVIQHRYGPCSPSLGKTSPSEILRQDQYRVNSLQARILKDHDSPIQVDDTTITARFGNSMGVGNYIVTVGFGTPKKDMTLAFDTGSDLTWIQCEPCTSCYQQQDPIFNPSESSSYTSIPCSSSECSQLGSGTCFQLATGESTCQYSILYGDKSTTRGSYAQETLALTSSDVFPEFLFGCGHVNDDKFGTTAGILGLGRRKESLVTQTAEKFGQVFSYCLPSSESSAGYLTFGADNVPSGIGYTPLKVNPSRPTFYYVGLTGISVNGQTLSVPSSTFTSSGTIIDSGTTITRLPNRAYTALTAAFRQAMPNNVPPPQGIPLETCYDMSTDGNVPKIVLNFEGMNLELNEAGVMYKVSDSLSCLAFLGGGDDLAIFGNTQQRTFGVVYDVPNSRLGFAAGGCT